jgi:hypothetical protein
MTLHHIVGELLIKYNISYVQCSIPQGSCLGSLLFSIFTNDLPLLLQVDKSILNADDCTLYTSTTTASELTESLSKVLQSVSEWVINNKLVLSASETKSIVFGSKHPLRPKPQLELCIKGVTIEQVEGAEHPGVTLDGQLP